MPGGGEICGDIRSTDPELLVHYHGHTSWPRLYVAYYTVAFLLVKHMLLSVEQSVQI